MDNKNKLRVKTLIDEETWCHLCDKKVPRAIRIVMQPYEDEFIQICLECIFEMAGLFAGCSKHGD